MSAIVSTVLVPASSIDLTDLATVKDELSLPTDDTSKDAWLGRAITQVSAACAQWCNRVFVIETVQDQIEPPHGPHSYPPPGNTPPLMLSRWPLVAPPVSLSAAASVAAGAVLTFAATTGVAAGQPASHDNIPAGTVVAAVDATSVTLSAPITGPIAAGDAVTFGLDVRVQEPTGIKRLAAGTDYRIDAANGALYRLHSEIATVRPWRPLPTTVSYQAGFATMPPDLIDAVLREITARFAARGRDPLLRSREQPGIGRQEWWVGTPPGVRGGFVEEIADLLDNYRVPVAI